MAKLTQPLVDMIKDALVDHPRLRDDGLCLIAKIWHDSEPAIRDMTAYGFLHNLASNEYASPESIIRCWRKVLEENPHLRGPKYKDRHKTTIPETIQSLRTLDFDDDPQERLL